MITTAEKLKVRWVSLTATVLSSSRYGSDYDRVKVLHEIGLDTPLLEDESFYIPHPEKTIDTREIFPDGNISNFAGQRFKDLQDELQQYSEAVKNGDLETMNKLNELFNKTAMLSTVQYKIGKQALSFEYDLGIYPKDNIFEISLWAPMPSFEIVPQGQVLATIQIPGYENQAFRATLLEASGFQPDANGNATNEIPKVLDQDYGLRRIIAWKWQNDPLFKIRYQYV